jgi:hypothetical protein
MELPVHLSSVNEEVSRCKGSWSLTSQSRLVKDWYGEPKRGGEWEPIKILLKGDRGSNKMNTASNTRLQLNYPSWSRPHSHWSATDPRNQQITFRAKTHQHAQRKLARLATCATPIRLMACAGQTGDTTQTGGQSRSGRWLHQLHNKCSREPQWHLSTLEQKHPQNTTCTEEEPYTKTTKTPPKLPRTDQHQHNPKTHGFSNSPKENPTKGSHRSDRCNLSSSGWTEPASQLLQIQLPICWFAPRIQTRLWG